MKLAIFYHIFQSDLGAFIYQEQVHRLYTSGLIKEASHIHFGVNGTQELFNVPDKAIVKYNQQQNWDSEKETLLDLNDFCKNNPDYKILYFHNKGSFNISLINNAWRLFMEHYVLDKWETCVKYLDEYDCCGTDYFKSYFLGNFWWANASYINKLNVEYLMGDDRYGKELWIGSCDTKNPKCLQYSQMTKDLGSFHIKIDDETVEMIL
jgi:hypothetical protein